MAPSDLHTSRAESFRRIRAFRLMLAFMLLAPVTAATTETQTDREFIIRGWDVEDGLPSSRVNAIAQTRDGYIWFGTLHGLVRFDGIRFVVFNTNNAPEIGNNHISALQLDSLGALWIGTRSPATGCVSRLKQGKFNRVDLGRTVPPVNALAAQDDRVWISLDGGGVIRWSASQLEWFGTNSGLPSPQVGRIEVNAGRVWANAGGALTEFVSDRWKPSASVRPSAQPVRALCGSANSGLWVATLAENPRGNRGGRVRKLIDGEFVEELTPYPWNQDSPQSKAAVLFEDSSGRLWYASYGAGIFYRDAHRPWQRLGAGGQLSQVIIDSMFEDCDGQIWIGTRAAGVYRLEPRAVTTLPVEPSSERNIFLTVCARRDGSIWGGTDGSGVLAWRQGILTRFGQSAGLANLHVGVLFEDRHTNLWAGTWGGLFRLENGSFKSISGPAALNKAVLALAEDRSGNLWIGTDAGLIRMKNGTFRAFDQRDGLRSLFIRAVIEDRAGQIWVAASEGGLFRLVGEHFERVAPGSWMAERMVRALHADADGTLWVATDGAGLVSLEGSHLKHFRVADGLPDHHLHSVIEDRLGNLWFSSDNGVFGFPKKVLREFQPGNGTQLTSFRLSRSEGMANKICSGAGQPTAAMAPDGRLWFPNGTSLASFHPQQLPREERPVAPLIEEAVLDGEPRALDADNVLRFGSAARRLELRFTVPNTRSAERFRFRIRMRGLDQQWMEVGATRSVSYSHLNPGRYDFIVAAAGVDGQWVEAARPLAIQVVPRFYQHRSVQVTAALLLLGSVAGGAWQISRARVRRHVAALEFQRAMDHERGRIARDIHDDLGSGLTEIIMEGDRLQAELHDITPVQDRIRTIASRARALTRAMDEVVWAINPRNDTLESLFNYLNTFAQDYLARAGLRCRCDAPPELPDVQLSAEARHNLYLASKEALHNVVKHSGATEVWIRLNIEAGTFTLAIEDNGRGLDPACVPGRGNGLGNMRRRLEDVGGSCDFSSAPGSGTCVRFTVAFKRARAARPALMTRVE